MSARAEVLTGNHFQKADIATKIRAVIIDDEPLAREKVRSFLDSETDVLVVAECADGKTALATIERLKPDVIFLDVQMPGLDAFGVLQELSNPSPMVVFTTAFDKYAVQAFDAFALDYLLKPFSRPRFQKTMQRVREHFHASHTTPVTPINEVHSATAPKYLDRFVFKSRGRIVFLKVEDIQWIGSEGNYMRINLAKESHLVRETMASLEAKLNPAMFLRIHRCALVNLQYIKEVITDSSDGDSRVVLHNGTQLALSRGHRAQVVQLLSR